MAMVMRWMNIGVGILGDYNSGARLRLIWADTDWNAQLLISNLAPPDTLDHQSFICHL